MFLSDNAVGAHPTILQALIEANDGPAPGYGADRWTQEASERLHAIFETDAAVYLTPSGTAANALSLASVCPPWGAVLCHRHAHIIEDEAGAPEFFTGGAKLIGIDGAHAQLTPDALSAEADRYSRAWVHGAQPFVVSISNLSESGAAYRAGAVSALGAVCRERGLALHMDGARFANALVSGADTPAAVTWRAGVDLLSFGATKNAALGVDAVISFSQTANVALAHLRKRAGHMMSKHRYLGAQMAAYLRDGLWLTLARHANAQAQALQAALRAKGAEILHPVDGNEVFARLDEGLEVGLRRAGCQFYAWAPDGARSFRFVTSWSTSDSDIAAVAGA
jgi:threonine aldolase